MNVAECSIICVSSSHVLRSHNLQDYELSRLCETHVKSAFA